MQMQRDLSHPSPELLPSTDRLNLLEMQLLNLFASSIKISLDGLNKRLTEDNLVPSIQRSKQEQRDIRNEEIASVPWHECRESLGKDNQNVEEDSVPREPGLPHCLVGKGIARDVSSGEGAHESNVGDVDAGPGDEASDAGYVDQPVEDLASAVGFVHEAQQTESSGEGDGVVGDTAGGGAGHPLGC